MACWDDERIDSNRTINRIVNGVFHHPAQRNQGEDGAIDGRGLMFGVVEGWWRSKDQQEQYDLRRQLSRDGVLNGENHKEGVHDLGHGCGKPLGMAKGISGSSGPASDLMGEFSSAFAGGQGGSNSGIAKFAEEAVGGGALGGLVGMLAGGVGESLLSGFENKSEVFADEGPTQQGGYQQSYTQVGRDGNQYGQAQYTETRFPSGGRQTEYQQYRQEEDSGIGFQQRSDTRPTYGGGYETTNERVYERSGGVVEAESWRERTDRGRPYENFEESRFEQPAFDFEQGEAFQERRPYGEEYRGNEGGWGERERERERGREREEEYREERGDEYRDERRREEGEEEYDEEYREERREERRDDEYREQRRGVGGWFT
jgi:hypothetical protein